MKLIKINRDREIASPYLSSDWVAMFTRLYYSRSGVVNTVHFSVHNQMWKNYVIERQDLDKPRWRSSDWHKTHMKLSSH